MGKPSSPPEYPKQQPDPLFAQQQQLAQQDEITALMAKTRGDTAAVMSRYGTAMAMRGFSGAPLGSL